MTRTLQIQLGAAVLALLIVCGAYAFAYHAVTKATETAASLSESIAAKTLASAHVAAAKRALSSLAEDEANVNRYFIQKDDVVPFLEGVQKTGKDLGTTVSVVSVTNDISGGHPHIALSLQIVGSFDAVLRTVGALEYGPYDSAVQSLTLDTTHGDSDTVWTASGVFLIGTQVPVPTAK